MHIRAQAYHLPKNGAKWREYEDACSPRHWRDYQVGSFRCAVADGATESSFAKTWARLLVHGFTKSCRGSSSQEWLREGLAWLQVRWWGRVARLALPWYLEEKLYQGAYAAFLGLEITPDRQWKALSAGDCCLFHLRGDQLQLAFPYTSAQQFPARPELVPSRGHLGEHNGVRTVMGTWEPGDVFYLMTDALAKWCLTCLQYQLIPWEAMPDWKLRVQNGVEERKNRFEHWVIELNKTGMLKNDDITLLRVDFFHGDE